MSEKAVRFVEEHFEESLEMLRSLVRIPSVSAPGFPPEEMRRSAEAVRAAMAECGLERCEVIERPGAHPAAYGEWCHAEGKPTVFLYAHHDVMPPGRAEHWESPAFEPVVRDGRLYGRGAADDKAGIVSPLAAIRAWLRTEGRLPVNVKFLVEGEEEIGSPNLLPMLHANLERMRSDVIVVNDTGNLETGRPCLTYRLRGVVNVQFEVTGLRHPVHSGMGGGPVPDPVQAMAKILASLTDASGAPAVPGFFDEVREVSAEEREAFRRLPFEEARFRQEYGMLEGTEFTGERDRTVFERNWVRPSITVIALEASPIQGSSNQVVPSARARISARLVPDMDPERTAEVLIRHLRGVAPWGMRVTAKAEHGAPAWMCDPKGPAFEAARRAMARGFGGETLLAGCGGSIPFVGPFSEAFGGAPALLLGLEDPATKPHAENESMHLGDLLRSMKTAACLFEELASTPARR